MQGWWVYSWDLDPRDGTSASRLFTILLSRLSPVHQSTAHGGRASLTPGNVGFSDLVQGKMNFLLRNVIKSLNPTDAKYSFPPEDPWKRENIFWISVLMSSSGGRWLWPLLWAGRTCFKSPSPSKGPLRQGLSSLSYTGIPGPQYGPQQRAGPKEQLSNVRTNGFTWKWLRHPTHSIASHLLTIRNSFCQVSSKMLRSHCLPQLFFAQGTCMHVFLCLPQSPGCSRWQGEAGVDMVGEWSRPLEQWSGPGAHTRLHQENGSSCQK